MTDPDMRAAALERFDEATRLLDETRTRLEALAAAEQHQQDVSRSIDEARAQIVDTASKLSEAVETALAGLSAMREVSAIAKTALASADPSQLVSQLGETRALIETAMTDRIQAAEAVRDETRSAHQGLLDKLAALPEKIRRKYNLP